MGRDFWFSWKGLVAILIAAYAVSTLLRSGGPPIVERDGMAVAAILADPGAPAAGPARGRVTLVVFTDYRCPSCRADADALADAMARNPDMRVLFKDWPILGPGSVAAARAALAAGYQGQYLAAHRALMAAPALDEAAIRTALVAAGINWERLADERAAHAAAIEARLGRNSADALSLGLSGTPGYLADRYLSLGRQGRSGFARLIATARDAR